MGVTPNGARNKGHYTYTTQFVTDFTVQLVTFGMEERASLHATQLLWFVAQNQNGRDAEWGKETGDYAQRSL